LLPRDDPPRPASPGVLVEEGAQAARPSRPAAAGSLHRAGPGSAGRCPARPASAGLPRRGAHPSRCRSRAWLVGARPALLGGLAFAALGRQALLLWPLPLQRGRGAALALRARQRREHPRCPASAARRMAGPAADPALDGAPYHRAMAVREAAAALQIDLVPLPGYSPDLMPVEAPWRWLREDITYNHCHRTAEALTPRAAP